MSSANQIVLIVDLPAGLPSVASQFGINATVGIRPVGVAAGTPVRSVQVGVEPVAVRPGIRPVKARSGRVPIRVRVEDD